LKRWLAEDKKKPSSFRDTRQDSHARSSTAILHANRFPQDILHELYGRVRAHLHQHGQHHADVSRGSRADTAGHRELQQVRADPTRAEVSRLAGGNSAASDGGIEIGGIAGYFAGLIAAARATLRPYEAAAAISNLLSQKAQAIRNAKDRRAVERQQPARPHWQPPPIYRQSGNG
jgi:hypothetical protein